VRAATKEDDDGGGVEMAIALAEEGEDEEVNGDDDNDADADADDKEREEVGIEAVVEEEEEANAIERADPGAFGATATATAAAEAGAGAGVIDEENQEAKKPCEVCGAGLATVGTGKFRVRTIDLSSLREQRFLWSGWKTAVKILLSSGERLKRFLRLFCGSWQKAAKCGSVGTALSQGLTLKSMLKKMTPRAQMSAFGAEYEFRDWSKSSGPM
jgi:hypothetical protein